MAHIHPSPSTSPNNQNTTYRCNEYYKWHQNYFFYAAGWKSLLFLFSIFPFLFFFSYIYPIFSLLRSLSHVNQHVSRKLGFAVIHDTRRTYTNSLWCFVYYSNLATLDAPQYSLWCSDQFCQLKIVDIFLVIL